MVNQIFPLKITTTKLFKTNKIMKNIFLIPTENPSRLYKGDNGLLAFGLMKTSTQSINDYFTNQNIYITSDEKFIRDEYITDGIEVIKASPKLVNAQGLVDRRNWKKIIITNDLELIKDGIQEIDDEFLRWFVLNPYCKEVEVEESTLLNTSRTYLDINKYKIIIPKEEQKQHLIDMMKSDEELGLYDESREIKVEDIFNDEKREKVKQVIHQHKVLQGLSLVNPAHLEMTSNGHGEFPDGYKLTEKGIQYIIEQLNKE